VIMADVEKAVVDLNDSQKLQTGVKSSEGQVSSTVSSSKMATIDDDERLLARIGIRQVGLSFFSEERSDLCRNYVENSRNGRQSRMPFRFSVSQDRSRSP
jgi:hypothetical protein